MDEEMLYAIEKMPFECDIKELDYGVLHRADARTVYDLNQQDIDLSQIDTTINTGRA